ncbi:hypothetical protein BG844_27665 [Couchioplanes caeruleus subsp. caeruleus]|uniref:Uncharacterized protein n=1 Tax=Couchioplanes caeruleus subsp. caeruleus TaxID=56427 RepID=A0A1K0FEI9_9ACTN|nr:hypothetical protein BG844_27665 [Couchioplanes caeruleus subsp. caeruleus]
MPPATADTEPPPPAQKGRSAALRKAARRHTSLSHKDRRELLGVASTAPLADEEEQANAAMVQPPLEPNDFALHPERSLMSPQMTPHEAAHGDEHAGEHPL